MSDASQNTESGDKFPFRFLDDESHKPLVDTAYYFGEGISQKKAIISSIWSEMNHLIHQNKIC